MNKDVGYEGMYNETMKVVYRDRFVDPEFLDLPQLPRTVLSSLGRKWKSASDGFCRIQRRMSSSWVAYSRKSMTTATSRRKSRSRITSERHSSGQVLTHRAGSAFTERLLRGVFRCVRFARSSGPSWWPCRVVYRPGMSIASCSWWKHAALCSWKNGRSKDIRRAGISGP